MITNILTLIVNIIKIIYSLICTFLLILFDYNKNILGNFLENLNVYGTVENLEKYQDFKNKHTNGIGLFNHTSYFDGIILMKELNEPLSFVCTKSMLIKMCKKLVEKWECLVLEPDKSTTKQITNKVLNRNKTESLLFIAPGGVDGMYETDKNKLAAFRTGAFVSLSPVLPVLIKYDPYTHIDDVHIVECLIKEINRPKINYKVKICDPIYPRKNDTIETFRDYVHDQMTEEFNEMTVDNIEVKQNDKLYIVLLILLILSYVLFTYDFKDYILFILFFLLIIIICLRNKNYIYEYLYKNLVYFYGIGLSLYSLANQNYLLFINSILYPFIYSIFNKY